ncbi:MAG: DnaJ domain-containing protein [Deltaproteobacteria bacterium]|nr:DnaJ domain-containing protein [Deltaproteobacteria bacterium]
MTPATDYYQLLQIEKSATPEEIKKAYRALALQYHPDLNPDEKSEEHIKNLNQAYAVLADPQQRQLYDLYGAVPRGQPYQQTARQGRPFGGCRGRGMGRGMGRGGCGGMGIWQEILRKR